MEFWDILKWILISFLALPVLLLPSGIYAWLWLSNEVFDFRNLLKTLKTEGVLKKVVVISLVFSLVLAWGIKGHMDKNVYVRYISHEASAGFQNLADLILLNDYIYRGVIDREAITVSDLNTLSMTNHKIVTSIESLNGLARETNRIKSQGYPISAEVAYDIHTYFRRLTYSLEENGSLNDNDEIALDYTNIEIIRLIYELNEAWVNLIVESDGVVLEKYDNRNHVNSNIYGYRYFEKALTRKYWTEFLIGLSEEANFFDTYKITNPR